MSLFRRCRHTWEVRMRRTYVQPITGADPFTVIYYVCTTCQKDRTRTEDGEFTLETSKKVFPRP